MCGYFFFSSRRRHTRLQGDWSSDVCSSDLRLREDRCRVDEVVVIAQSEERLGPEVFPPAAHQDAIMAVVVESRETSVQIKDRKSTRLNSSHLVISYAVFCLKKKNKKNNEQL